VADEGDRRGYGFDRAKLVGNSFGGKIAVTAGQVEYEFAHLLAKLKKRDPALYRRWEKIEKIELHPMFEQIGGDVEEWEVI
jgi:hypothetical protein